MTEKNDLFKGIDEAADNLFSQYVVKKTPAPEAPPAEPPPASPAPPPSPQAATPESEPLDLEIEPGTAPAASPVAAAPESTIMEQMTEVLLSIDWEVSPANLSKGRQVLADMVRHYGLNTDSPASLVAVQMDKVLATMQDNPKTVPVSAPSQLKKALEAIRTAVAQGASPDAGGRKLLSQVLSELHAVLEVTPAKAPGAFDSGLELDLTLESSESPPVAAVAKSARPAPRPAAAPAASQPEKVSGYGLELSLESETNQGQPDSPVTAETAQVLKAYSNALSAAIKCIAPMEKLFTNRPGMEKLHAVNKHVREKLSGQVRLLSQTFSADYTSYTGLGTVNSWLESQLDILNPCVKRLTKVENLFAKTNGYEKLYELTKKVRKSLAAQQEAITSAVGGVPVTHQFDLTGEYPALQPVLDRAPEAPAAAVSAVVDPRAVLESCLGLARKIESGELRAGQDVGHKLRENLEKIKSALAGAAISSSGAVAAAQTAVAAAGKINAKCRWDWLLKTSWGSQLVGLAPEQVAFESHTPFPAKLFRDKTYFSLNKLKAWPWTNLQSLFSGDLGEVDKATLNEMELEIAKPPETFRGSTQKKVYMVIMYHAGKGKVFLLDAPTEAISITDEGLWVPGTQDSDIAGTLTVYGSIMPVIALS